jgi:hypothetical protein
VEVAASGASLIATTPNAGLHILKRKPARKDRPTTS